MASELEIEGLGVELEARTVLEGVSLRVERGERWAVLGPNGSGKTTLLRAVLGLTPHRGTIRIGGRDRGEYDRRGLARRVALLRQDEGLEFALTAGEVVLSGRSPHKGWLEADSHEDLTIARSALASTSTAELEPRIFPTLSGGERQRVLLSRTLAQAPELLLLDEPTNHLDLEHQIEILRVIADRGLTSVAALHDLNLAAQFATHALFLSGGRIAASGPIDEVLTPARISALFRVEAERLVAPDGRAVFMFRPRRS